MVKNILISRKNPLPTPVFLQKNPYSIIERQHDRLAIELFQRRHIVFRLFFPLDDFVRERFQRVRVAEACVSGLYHEILQFPDVIEAHRVEIEFLRLVAFINADTNLKLRESIERTFKDF